MNAFFSIQKPQLDWAAPWHIKAPNGFIFPTSRVFLFCLLEHYSKDFNHCCQAELLSFNIKFVFLFSGVSIWIHYSNLENRLLGASYIFQVLIIIICFSLVFITKKLYKHSYFLNAAKFIETFTTQWFCNLKDLNLMTSTQQLGFFQCPNVFAIWAFKTCVSHGCPPLSVEALQLEKKTGNSGNGNNARAERGVYSARNFSRWIWLWQPFIYNFLGTRGIEMTEMRMMGKVRKGVAHRWTDTKHLTLSPRWRGNMNFSSCT